MFAFRNFSTDKKVKISYFLHAFDVWIEIDSGNDERIKQIKNQEKNTIGQVIPVHIIISTLVPLPH